MIENLLYLMTAVLPCRLIKLDGLPYMERYYLGKWFGRYRYLHRFVRSDSERHLHDHPWPVATSRVLTGRYIEERADLAPIQVQAAKQGKRPIITPPHRKAVTRRNRLTSSRTWHTSIHRITDVQPETWTLFSHGEWDREWGFYQLDKWNQQILSYRPYAAATRGKIDLHWWLDAPKGRNAGREPFGRHA